MFCSLLFFPFLDIELSELSVQVSLSGFNFALLRHGVDRRSSKDRPFSHTNYEAHYERV